MKTYKQIHEVKTDYEKTWEDVKEILAVVFGFAVMIIIFGVLVLAY